MTNLKFWPVIGGILFSIVFGIFVVAVSTISDESVNAQPNSPAPISADTLVRFNKELETVIRTQHKEELAAINEQREVLDRIERAIFKLSLPAAIKAPAVVKRNQPVKTYKKSTRFYYATPKRRTFLPQITQDKCVNGICPK